MAQEDLTMKCGAELNFVRQFFRVYFSRAVHLLAEVTTKFLILLFQNSEKFPILSLENT